jgi:hypothetical protein
MYARGTNPRGQRVASLFGEFELNGTLGLLLHDYRPRGDDTSMTSLVNDQSTLRHHLSVGVRLKADKSD